MSNKLLKEELYKSDISVDLFNNEICYTIDEDFNLIYLMSHKGKNFANLKYQNHSLIEGNFPIQTLISNSGINFNDIKEQKYYYQNNSISRKNRRFILVANNININKIFEKSQELRHILVV